MTDYSQRTITELAAALHMRRRQLQPSRPRPVKTSAEVEAEVRQSIELLKSGIDPREVAEMIGISFPAMRQRLYDRGVMIEDFSNASREET